MKQKTKKNPESNPETPEKAESTTMDKRDLEKLREEPAYRAMSIGSRNKIDVEARTVELSFSSEAPVERWYGEEILGHGAEEVDLSRFEDGAAVLFNHDAREHVGIVERVWIDGDKGRAVVRFGNSSRAAEVFQDVQDGILRHVSVGYFVREVVLMKQSEDGPDVYRVSRWMPFEVSMVPIPADASVGVGRSFAIDKPAVDEPDNPVEPSINETLIEERKMTEEVTPGADDAAREAAIRAATDKAATESRSAERARVSELLKTGETYGAQDLAQRCIEDGKSVDVLNKMILERNGLEAVKAEDPQIGMTETETRRFSFVRLLNAMVDPTDAKAREAAAFEIDACRAAAEKLKKEARGMVVPFDVLSAQRAHTVGSATAGGNLVETELLFSSFIEKLENALALRQLGVTMLPGLNGNIAIPRQTGGASHFWVAENGAPTESNATFDQVAMTPKTVGAYTEISRRTLLQAGINVESFVENELALRLALAIDLAGINGSGAGNQPTGVLNTSGVDVQPGATNGKAPDWDDFVNMETNVADANAAIGSLGYLVNAKVRGYAKRTFIDPGSGERIWDSRAGETPLNGYRAAVSNQVPGNLTKGTGTNLSAAIFGNWADLIIGMWGGLDILVNPYSLDTTGAVRVTSFQDVDINVRHPESFSVINDAITT